MYFQRYIQRYIDRWPSKAASNAELGQRYMRLDAVPNALMRREHYMDTRHSMHFQRQDAYPHCTPNRPYEPQPLRGDEMHISNMFITTQPTKQYRVPLDCKQQRTIPLKRYEVGIKMQFVNNKHPQIS